ncbi:hypothetical protein PR048_017619 [Dryococelus australis]|uniref:Uncharacterized protein n=1 Tax=Dryococelus australis TaxID=614101 RepID=A0ABQ9HA02_9NEOP|nr:hypothetical protein PR048_017619 [Dryococelus australis]
MLCCSRNHFFLFPAAVEDPPRPCMQFLFCVDARIDIPALALEPPAQDGRPLSLEETTSAHTLLIGEEATRVGSTLSEEEATKLGSTPSEESTRLRSTSSEEAIPD